MLFPTKNILKKVFFFFGIVIFGPVSVVSFSVFRNGIDIIGYFILSSYFVKHGFGFGLKYIFSSIIEKS